MGYKWKPSASQRAAFAAAHQAAKQHEYINSPHPIRTKDDVEFFDLTTESLRSGTVLRHSYGAEKGQHTFTLSLTDGSARLIKGRNLYPRLTKHTHKGAV